MENDQALYLRLSEDFGGTRFGPFTGVEVGLGSGRENPIQIPESFGVSPDHAKVLIQEGRGILITPTSHTSSVYVWKGKASKPTQISTPTAVRHGDSFALVSAHGPRFFIEVDLLPEDMRKGGLPNFRGKENLNKGAMKKEARRRALLRLMTTGWGQRISKAWWYVRSGEIFLPRNLFMIFGIAGGWVMGTMAMCSKADTEAEVEALALEIEDLNERQGSKDHITLANQLARVTGVPQLEGLFRKNPELAGALRILARSIYQRPDDHAWLSTPQSRGRRHRDFTETYEEIQTWSDVDEGTRRLLPWANATRVLEFQAEDNTWWGKMRDSNDQDVCMRGPIGMTWAQAQNLRMSAKIDTFSLEKLQAGEETIRAFNKSALRVPSFDRSLIQEDIAVEVRRPEGNDFSYCYTEPGGDDRDSLSGVRKSLRPGKGGLPEMSRSAEHLPLATLLTFFAKDTRGAGNLDFRSNITTGLAGVDQNALGWVQSRALETVAAAAIVPCIARTEANDDEFPDTIAGDSVGLYEPIDCILLRYVVEKEDVVRQE